MTIGHTGEFAGFRNAGPLRNLAITILRLTGATCIALRYHATPP